MTASQRPAAIRKVHSDSDAAPATAAVVVLCASGPARRRASSATGLLRAFCFRAQLGTTRGEQRRIICVKGLLKGAPKDISSSVLSWLEHDPAASDLLSASARGAAQGIPMLSQLPGTTSAPELLALLGCPTGDRVQLQIESCLFTPGSGDGSSPHKAITPQDQAPQPQPAVLLSWTVSCPSPGHATAPAPCVGVPTAAYPHTSQPVPSTHDLPNHSKRDCGTEQQQHQLGSGTGLMGLPALRPGALRCADGGSGGATCPRPQHTVGTGPLAARTTATGSASLCGLPGPVASAVDGAPWSLTLLQFPGRVLFQNQQSRQYWGQLEGRALGVALLHTLLLGHGPPAPPQQQQQQQQALTSGRTPHGLPATPGEAAPAGSLSQQPPSRQRHVAWDASGEQGCLLDSLLAALEAGQDFEAVVQVPYMCPDGQLQAAAALAGAFPTATAAAAGADPAFGDDLLDDDDSCSPFLTPRNGAPRGRSGLRRGRPALATAPVLGAGGGDTATLGVLCGGPVGYLGVELDTEERELLEGLMARGGRQKQVQQEQLQRGSNARAGVDGGTPLGAAASADWRLEIRAAGVGCSGSATAAWKTAAGQPAARAGREEQQKQQCAPCTPQGGVGGLPEAELEVALEVVRFGDGMSPVAASRLGAADPSAAPLPTADSGSVVGPAGQVAVEVYGRKAGAVAEVLPARATVLSSQGPDTASHSADLLGLPLTGTSAYLQLVAPEDASRPVAAAAAPASRVNGQLLPAGGAAEGIWGAPYSGAAYSAGLPQAAAVGRASLDSALPAAYGSVFGGGYFNPYSPGAGVSALASGRNSVDGPPPYCWRAESVPLIAQSGNYPTDGTNGRLSGGLMRPLSLPGPDANTLGPRILPGSSHGSAQVDRSSLTTAEPSPQLAPVGGSPAPSLACLTPLVPVGGRGGSPLVASRTMQRLLDSVGSTAMTKRRQQMAVRRATSCDMDGAAWGCEAGGCEGSVLPTRDSTCQGETCSGSTLAAADGVSSMHCEATGTRNADECRSSSSGTGAAEGTAAAPSTSASPGPGGVAMGSCSSDLAAPRSCDTGSGSGAGPEASDELPKPRRVSEPNLGLVLPSAAHHAAAAQTRSFSDCGRGGAPALLAAVGKAQGYANSIASSGSSSCGSTSSSGGGGGALAPYLARGGWAMRANGGGFGAAGGVPYRHARVARSARDFGVAVLGLHTIEDNEEAEREQGSLGSLGCSVVRERSGSQGLNGPRMGAAAGAATAVAAAVPRPQAVPEVSEEETSGSAAATCGGAVRGSAGLAGDGQLVKGVGGAEATAEGLGVAAAAATAWAGEGMPGEAVPGAGNGALPLAVADPWVGVVKTVGGCEVLELELAVKAVAALPCTGPGSNTTTGTSISLGAPATEEQAAAVEGDPDEDAGAANGCAIMPSGACPPPVGAITAPAEALAAPTLLQPFNSAPAPLAGGPTASAPAPPRPLVRASSDAAALMSLSAARHAAELGAAAAGGGAGAPAARLSYTGAGGGATSRQPAQVGAAAVAALSGMQPGMSTGGAAIARAVLQRTRSNGTYAMQSLVAAAAGGAPPPQPPVRPPSLSGTPASTVPWNSLSRNSNSRRWGTPPSGSGSATRPPSAGSATPPASALQPSTSAAAAVGTAVTLGPPPLVSIRTARRASTSFIGLGSMSPGLLGAPYPNGGSNPGPGAGAGAGGVGVGGRQSKRLLRRQSTNARLQQLLTTYSELVNTGTALEERAQLLLLPAHPEDGSGTGADGLHRLQGVKAVAVAAMAAEGAAMSEASRSGLLPSIDTARSDLGGLLSLGSVAAAGGQSPAYAMGFTQSSVTVAAGAAAGGATPPGPRQSGSGSAPPPAAPPPSAAPSRMVWQKVHVSIVPESTPPCEAEEGGPSGEDGPTPAAAAATGPGGGKARALTLAVTQVDVTEEVAAQVQLSALLQKEHKVLESIFPRHIIEYMALGANEGGPAGGPGGAAGAAVGGGRGGGGGGGAPCMSDSLQRLASLATWHPSVTILFCDIVGFTEFCGASDPFTVMAFLNDLYSRFDSLVDIYKVYKVETIGDCYLVAGGLVAYDRDGYKSVLEGAEDPLHAVRVMEFAKAMLRASREVRMPHTGQPVRLRVGLHSGPATSGVVGERMPRFCLFGDTVNVASRMESTCRPGTIHVSSATRALLPAEAWHDRGLTAVKGKGDMRTYEWGGSEDAPWGEGQLQRVLGLL